MQLKSFLITLPLLLIASTVSADCGGASTWVSNVKPDSTLTTPERQLSISGGTVYIGSIKYSGRVERLVLNYPGNGKPGGGTGGLTFTNYYSSPTGWRNAYVFPNRSEPIGFTTPHSAYVPQGADTGGFSIGRDDRLLRYKNFNSWYACPTTDYERTYKIHYVGDGQSVPEGCVKIDIPATGYGFKDWSKEELDAYDATDDL